MYNIIQGSNIMLCNDPPFCLFIYFTNDLNVCEHSKNNNHSNQCLRSFDLNICGRSKNNYSNTLHIMKKIKLHIMEKINIKAGTYKT